MKISGINLKIDESVQKLCEVSNKSSTSTRSLVYVILLTCILALIAVINTHPWNWTKDRYLNSIEKIKKWENIQKKITSDSLKIRDALWNLEKFIKIERDGPDKESVAKKIAALELIQSKYRLNLQQRIDSLIKLRKLIVVEKIIRDKLIWNKIDHFQTLSIPILSNSVDINDLSLVVGVTLCILLIILRFTLRREHSNLTIVLNAITERYTNTADRELFVKENPSFNDDAVTEVNMTRRRHHYNYLSMNEVLTLASIVIHGKEFVKTTDKEKRIVDVLFMFPLIIYSIIVANDCLTAVGYDMPGVHLGFTIFFGVVLIIPIGIVSLKCTRENRNMIDLYEDFREKNYRFDKKVLEDIE